MWSSVTLYDEKATGRRELWFRAWLGKNGMPGRKEVLTFHRSVDPEDRENSICMNRGWIQTISITSVYSAGGNLTMEYHDLAGDFSGSAVLPLNEFSSRS
jgi:hypothetical protein